MYVIIFLKRKCIKPLCKISTSYGPILYIIPKLHAWVCSKGKTQLSSHIIQSNHLILSQELKKGGGAFFCPSYSLT